MLRHISIALMLAFSSVVSAAAPEQIDFQAEGKNTVYSDELSGFAVSKTGAISLLARQLPTSDMRSNIGSYRYDSMSGNKSINVIDRQNQAPDSMQISPRGNFVAQAVYGQLMWIPPYSSVYNVPAGWAAVSGNYPQSILIKYIAGAPYGRVEILNSAFGIPLQWVRTNPNPGGGYAHYTYVAGAPFASEIFADSSFPIPAIYVRVNGNPSGYGTFRNTAGAPSGTQWYVDARFGVPPGWTYMDQGYPYRWARKN
jgi:hypothetical protein